MDEIRIQIVNYRTKKYVIECLSSLSEDLKDFDGSYSVAILDNASGDDISDLLQLFPQLKSFSTQQGKQNIGFGAGHNYLAKKGNAEFLLLLNPDIRIIEANTVLRLLESAQENNAQVIGPRLVTGERQEQQWWDHGEINGIIAKIALNAGAAYWQKRTKPTEVAWVSGAVLLVNKKWFDEVKRFDENFFLYKEEEDLCWRLREKGGKTVYIPTITLFHYAGVVAGKSKYIQQSADYFIQKHLQQKPLYSISRFINRLINR